MKKFLLLTLTFLALGFAAAPVSAQTVWDGTADITWYDANQASFDLSTPEQLAGVFFDYSQNRRLCPAFGQGTFYRCKNKYFSIIVSKILNTTLWFGMNRHKEHRIGSDSKALTAPP